MPSGFYTFGTQYFFLVVRPPAYRQASTHFFSLTAIPYVLGTIGTCWHTGIDRDEDSELVD